MVLTSVVWVSVQRWLFPKGVVPHGMHQLTRWFTEPSCDYFETYRFQMQLHVVVHEIHCGQTEIVQRCGTQTPHQVAELTIFSLTTWNLYFKSENMNIFRKIVCWVHKSSGDYGAKSSGRKTEGRNIFRPEYWLRSTCFGIMVVFLCIFKAHVRSSVEFRLSDFLEAWSTLLTITEVSTFWCCGIVLLDEGKILREAVPSWCGSRKRTLQKHRFGTKKT